MSKKHRQHKRVALNTRRGLIVGGVVVPYWSSYWNGIGGGGDVHHGHTTSEGAHNDSGSSDAGAGADSSGSM